MKPTLSLRVVRHGSLAAMLAALITGHSAYAANGTWNGTTDGFWSTLTNWSSNPNPVPGSGNTATFSNAGGGFTTLDLGAGVTVQQITFDTNLAAGYTIGNGGAGAQTLTFNGGGVTLNSNVVNDQLFNANIVLGTANGNQGYTFTNNNASKILTFAGGISSTTTGIKTLTVNGAGNTSISGALTNGTGSLALVKAGAGTLTLSGSGNSFTGSTTVSGGGTIRTSADNILSDGSQLILSEGTIDLNGNSDTIGTGSGNAIYFGATSGPIASKTSTISTGAGTLTLAGNIAADSDAKQQMIISGKLDLGVATRTVQNHTYNATPGSSAERVQIRIQADISGTGVGINVIRGNDGNATVGVLLSGNNTYTGTTTLNNSAIEADSATALGNGGDVTFTGGGGAILKYTANSAATDWSTRFKNSNQAVRLDTNGQTVTLAGIIASTNTGGLTKLGAGNLVLSGANAYTGNTTISAGTLQSGTSDVVPNASSVIVSGNAAGVTAIFDLNGNSDTIASLSFGGSTATSGAAVTTGLGILTLNGNVSYDATSNPLGATLGGNLALGTATRTFTINDSATAADDLTVSSAVTGGVGVGLAKAGTGTLVLSGTNGYLGATSVSGGVLRFDSLASIAGSGRNLTVTSPGAVALGYVPGTTIQDDLLSRIVSSSTGAVALTSATGEDFDFSSAGPANNFTGLFLGAIGNVTYNGTLTPNGTIYRLGGGGGTLTMANANAVTGAGNTLVVGGGVILSGDNDFTGITTINSGATLQLDTGASGVGSTSIVDNGTLIFNNPSSSSYAGVISGGGALIKTGAGELSLSAPQTYTGQTTVNGGTLTLGANHTLAVNKALVVNTGGTLDLGSNSQYVGQFTGTGGIVTGSSGRFTTNAANGTFAGSIQGSLDFVKAGANTLILTADSTTTGTVSVIGGGLTLKDGGMLSANAGLIVNGATLTLDNTGTSNVNGRVNSASLVLNGGTVTYNGANNTASTESIGAVTLNSGVSIIQAIPAGSGTRSAVLTLGSLTRSTGAALNVNPGGNNLGASLAANPHGNVLVTGGLTGNLATVNGVVPGVFSAFQDDWNLVGYDNTLGFGRLGTAGFPATTATWSTAGATSNLTAGGAVDTGGKSINSINQGTVTFTNGTSTGGPDLLTINSGMAIMATQTFGTTSARGRVTSGTQELIIGHRDGNATPSPIIHSVIENNGNPVSLVVYSKKGDRGPYVELTAANTYSGGTFVSGGNALGGILLNAGSSSVVIPAGGLTIDNLGVVDEAGFQGQIDPSNDVTINGGGMLRLMGANTLASITFISNGGTQVPTVIPYNTITRDANTNNYSIFGAKTGTLTITGNITSTPTNVAVTPLIDSGNLNLNGTDTHDISVSALPEGNFVNTLTPLNGLTISSVIQNGGFTKKGGGVLNLTGTGSTYAGQLTVEEGVLNVASVNNISSNGVLGNSASSVILGGSGGKTGTLEYTAGNTTSSKPFTMATGGAGTFQVDAEATVLTLSGLIDGAGDLAKTGLGTLKLTAAAGLTGDTTIKAGTLKLDGSGSIDSSPTIIVGDTGSAGAVLDVTTKSGGFTVGGSQTLGGIGTISGPVNVSGVLAPGASVETLASGALSFSDLSTFAYEVNSSAAATVGADLMKVTGNLDLTGTVSLTFSDIAVSDTAFTTGTIFSLLNFTGTWNGGKFSFGGNELDDNEQFSAGLNVWEIDYNALTGGLNYSGEYAGGADSFINLTAISGASMTPYQTWASGFSGPALSNQASDADPDQDGLENGLEYVLGTDPRFTNQGGPTGSVVGTDLKFTFNRKDSSETVDVALHVQVSTNLTDWTTIPGYTIGATTGTSTAGVNVNEAGPASTDIITVTIPKGSDTKKFARLRVIVTP